MAISLPSCSSGQSGVLSVFCMSCMFCVISLLVTNNFNVIIQQRGVKFWPSAESVQSPYHKKGMFPRLQGTIKLKAVSRLFGRTPHM